MPIYEYACRRCKGEFQTLIMSASDEEALLCPTCGSRRLGRLISRVAYHQSERDRLESYDPAAPHSDSFYRDSRNIGLQAKKRAQQMGVDLGSGFESKLEKLRTDPGSVLKDSE
jgi:putative FmdB family regulatory protein